MSDHRSPSPPLPSCRASPAPSGSDLDYAAAILGCKWTILILRELAAGSRRFRELQTDLAGISPRTLSQRLRRLQREELVLRRSYPTVPPRVDYSLTARGRALEPVLAAMRGFESAVRSASVPGPLAPDG